MFYIAGKYTAKDRLAYERKSLRSMGFAVSSSWLDEVYGSDGDKRVTNEIRKENAQRDMVEVVACRAFVIDTQDENASGGREVELGMALALGKPCYRIGPYRNVFHTLVDYAFPSWDDFYTHLNELS